MKSLQETTAKWLYPWNVEVFNDMNHDNRFFALLIKALLSYLDSTVTLYSKGVRHFILSTGKEYLYQESNGYNFSWSETTGEDMIYMQKPRCVVSWDQIEIETNSLSSPYARGVYERPVQVVDEILGDHIEIREYTSEVRILPVKIPVTLRYVLSNFNEALIMTEQFLTLFTMTRYFSFSYLGQKIDCSAAFPQSFTPATLIKTDYNAESKNREIELKIDLKTIYPVMFKNTEIETSNVIKNFVHTASFYKGSDYKPEPDDKRVIPNPYPTTPKPPVDPTKPKEPCIVPATGNPAGGGTSGDWTYPTPNPDDPSGDHGSGNPAGGGTPGDWTYPTPDPNNPSGDHGTVGSDSNNPPATPDPNNPSGDHGTVGSDSNNPPATPGNGESGSSEDKPVIPVIPPIDGWEVKPGSNPQNELVLRFSENERQVIERIMNDKDLLYQVIQRSIRNSEDGAALDVTYTENKQ